MIMQYALTIFRYLHFWFLLAHVFSSRPIYSPGLGKLFLGALLMRTNIFALHCNGKMSFLICLEKVNI